MIDLLVYGGGHLGRQVLHHLKHYYADTTRVLGFIDDTKPAGTVIADDLTNLGPLESVSTSAAGSAKAVQVVFAVGYSNMLARRRALRRILELEYRLFSIIHPRACVEPNAVVGQGSIILAGAVVDQQVQIGNACFVDIGVTIGEHSRIGTNNYMSAGTSIGGSVTTGDDCFLGMDVTVTNDVVLGHNLFVNAKTLVHRNRGDNLRLVEMHSIKEIALGK